MIRKPPRTCSATTQIDRLPQGNESCRTATQVGLLHTPADSVPSTHPHEVHTVTPPLAPSQRQTGTLFRRHRHPSGVGVEKAPRRNASTNRMPIGSRAKDADANRGPWKIGGPPRGERAATLPDCERHEARRPPGGGGIVDRAWNRRLLPESHHHTGRHGEESKVAGLSAHRVRTKRVPLMKPGQPDYRSRAPA
jgi:hypothetical protein